MKNEIDSKKSELRQKMIDVRDALSSDSISSKNSLIQQLLFELPVFQQAQVVMFYVSFRSEVATQLMIEDALLSGKEVVVPAVNLTQKELEPFQIENMDQLTLGTYGILEPVNRQKPAEVEVIDLVIVPGCAFDPQGYRLGYGVGYYDRFLKTVAGSCSVGLAFELQMVPEIPRQESHDVPVDLIITEKRVIDCRQSRPA